MFAQAIARSVQAVLRPELESIQLAITELKRQVGPGVPRGVDEHARARAALLRVLARKGQLRKRDLARLTGLTGYRLKRFIEQLLAEGALRRKGYARGTVYLKG